MKSALRKNQTERRREIIDVVFALIGEEGISALTTKNIAARLGLSNGAIFRHFASLEELLGAAALSAVEALEATFPDDDESPKGRLFALAQSRVKLLAEKPGMAWMLTSDQAQIVLPSDAKAALKKVSQRSKRYLLKALRDAQAQGEIREDVEAACLLVIVTGVIHRLIGSAGIHGSARGAPSADGVLNALERMLKPSMNEAS
ncbi:MAG: TetR/AcrR family transcriptional regulator [Planctomycetes bacterium]|nr:TetR/AcrR family transcriptional regulator [Planctomycetota bacterium]